MTFFPFDWHTPTHLFGSYFLVHVLRRITAWINGKEDSETKFASFVLALSLGLGWEVLDQVFAGQWIFDLRGGDFADIAADVIGVLLGLVI